MHAAAQVAIDPPGHEGDAAALLGGDVAQCLLGARDVVRALDRRARRQVDLDLARRGLVAPVVPRDPERVEPPQHSVHELLEVLRSGHQIGDPRASPERRQVTVALRAGLLDRLLEDHELDLGPHRGPVAEVRQASGHPLQQPAVADRERGAVEIGEVAEHRRPAVAPGQRDQCRRVGDHLDVGDLASPRAPVPADRHLPGRIDTEAGVGEQRALLQRPCELRRGQVLAEHEPVVVGGLQPHAGDPVRAQPALDVLRVNHRRRPVRSGPRTRRP